MTTQPTDSSKPSSEELARCSGLAMVRVFEELDSTQLVARRMADDGSLALPGAVVTWRQTAGRGRAGNRWWSDEGSLTVTFALSFAPPIVHDQPIHQLPLRVGVAIREALLPWVADERLMLKWPNDILATTGDDKTFAKLAGILCERVRTADLIGVGINISADLSQAPADVRGRGISIRALSNHAPSRLEVFGAIGRAVQKAWTMEDWNAKFNACHALSRRRVMIGEEGAADIEGICEGVDTDGRLIVNDGEMTHRLMNGTVLKF